MYRRDKFIHGLVKSPKKIGHMEYPSEDGRIILKISFQEVGQGGTIGLIWLRIGRDGGLL